MELTHAVQIVVYFHAFSYFLDTLFEVLQQRLAVAGELQAGHGVALILGRCLQANFPQQPLRGTDSGPKPLLPLRGSARVVPALIELGLALPARGALVVWLNDRGFGTDGLKDWL